MSWLIKVPGFDLNSDDMTIGDLGNAERISGEAWSVANPFRSVAVAKAFYSIALAHSGMTDKDVTATLEGVTLRDLKGAFEWVDDEEGEEAEDVDPSAQPQSPTTPGSFYGVSVGDSPPA